MYILFEGIDTCGKSTQIELLKQNTPDIVVTKEPGGTNFGKKAREILLNDSLSSKRAELLLFIADRAEHYHEVIAANKDRVVVSDRGFISGVAYALANDDFKFDELMMLNRFALEDTMPDKIILFLTDMETLKERTSNKELDGIELRGLEYLLNVQEHMKQSIIRLDIPHLFVDARDTIENINKSILTYLKI